MEVESFADRGGSHTEIPLQMIHELPVLAARVAVHEFCHQPPDVAAWRGGMRDLVHRIPDQSAHIVKIGTGASFGEDSAHKIARC
jgi:hypothetical protein